MTWTEQRSWLSFGDYKLDGDFLCHTKAGFEKNPRANEIRMLTVGVVKNLARILWDDSLTNEDRQKLQNESCMLGEELVGLGVYQNIHVGRRPKTFWKSAGITAEYVAGQLLPYTGYVPPVSEVQLRPAISEFNLTERQNGIILETKQLPPKVNEFFVDGWMVGNAVRELDCAEEVWFKQDPGMFEGL